MRAYWRAYVSYRIGSAYTLSRVRSSYEDRKLSNRSNFFFFPRNQIFLLLSIHSISSIIVVSNNTPTHRSIRYREINRCRNSGNTVISVIGRAYRTRLFIYIYIRISTRYRPPPRFLDRSARFVFFARARRTIN